MHIIKKSTLILIFSLSLSAEMDLSEYKKMTSAKLADTLETIVSQESYPKAISPLLSVTDTTLNLRKKEFDIVVEVDKKLLPSEVVAYLHSYKNRVPSSVCANEFVRYLFSRGYSQKYIYTYNDKYVDTLYVNEPTCKLIDKRDEVALEFLSAQQEFDKALEEKKLSIDSDEYRSKVERLNEKSKEVDALSCLDTPLHVELRRDDFDGVKKSLSDDNINIINCRYETPLLLTLNSKDATNRALFLIKNGADIDLDIKMGERLIHQAIKLNHNKKYNEYIKMLIALGASLELKDQDGNTPLVLAIKLSQDEIASLILKNSTSLDEVNGFGKSALFYAVQYENEKLTRELLEQGASLELLSNDNESVFELSSVKMKKILSSYKKSAHEYYINVYAFRTYKPSKEYLKSITDNGYSYKYVKSESGLTKLYIGPFHTQKSALKELYKIKSKIEKDAFIVK